MCTVDGGTRCAAAAAVAINLSTPLPLRFGRKAAHCTVLAVLCAMLLQSTSVISSWAASEATARFLSIYTTRRSMSETHYELEKSLEGGPQLRVCV